MSATTVALNASWTISRVGPGCVTKRFNATVSMTNAGSHEHGGIAHLPAITKLEVHVRAAADARAAKLREYRASLDALSRDHVENRVVRVHRDPAAGVNDHDHVAVSADFVARVANNTSGGRAHVPTHVACDVDRLMIMTFS